LRTPVGVPKSQVDVKAVETQSMRAPVLALLALWGLYLAPIWAATALPFVDLPWHLADARIVRAQGSPGAGLGDLFTVSMLLRPNVAHLAFTSAPWFSDVESGNRVFYSLYLVAVPALLLALIRQHRGNPWLALLGFPLVYSYSVNYGFTEFTAAIPLLLLALLAVGEYHRRPSAGRAAAAMVATTLVYFAHAIACVFAMLFGVVYALARKRRTEGFTFLPFLIPMPAIALTLFWQTGDPRGHNRPDGWLGWLVHYYETSFLHDYPARLFDLITEDNRALVGPIAGRAVAALIVLIVLAPLVVGLRKSRREDATVAEESDRRLLRALRLDERLPLVVFIACAIGLCLLAPPGIPPYWSIYQRFSVMVLLGAVVLASTYHRPGLPRPMVLSLIAVVVAHATLWADHILAFGREVRDMASLFPAPAPGRVLCPVVSEPAYRGEPEAFRHAANYYTVWDQGLVASALYDFQFTAVGLRAAPTRLPHEWDCLSSAAVTNALVRGPRAAEGARRAGFEPLATRGAWALYRRALIGSASR
jgi:hypothetical protein